MVHNQGRMMRSPILASLTILTAWAQIGEPIKITGNCTEDDIQSYGMSCSTEEPCKIYLELSSLESIGSRLILAGNLHTSDVTLSSVLLTSEDGGKTWKEPIDRIKTATLDAMQFLDFENGWINGQLVQSFPKDPFFLVTRDGGKSWRNIPIFNESRSGTVDKFHFENKNDGVMLLDRIQSGDSGGRWASYETRTAGDSWELKQVTQKKPEFKKVAATSNADWRLVAVAKTKIYRVEHRAAGKWEVAVTFHIEAGECKVAERNLAPPVEPDAVEKEPAASGVFQIPGRTPPPTKKKQ